MTAEEISLVRTTLETVRDYLAYKRAKDDPERIPTADDILAAALDATGHADGYAAESLTGREHLEILHAVRLEARRVLRGMAEAFVAESAEPAGVETAKALFGTVKDAVGGFFGRAAKVIREAIVAGVLAVAGPDPAVAKDAVVQEAIERQVAIQATYLEQFKQRVLSEARPLDGGFVANTEQYGSSVWGASQEAVREIVKKRLVFDQERREHIGPWVDPGWDPCNTCIFEEAAGWGPIGTRKAIGDSECKCHCHCTFVFRKGDDGEEHYAGRGPLSEAAFGRTG